MRDDHGPKRRGEILTLRGTKPYRHFFPLNVTRRPVVKDCVAKNIRGGICSSDIHARWANHCRDLEFIVDYLPLFLLLLPLSPHAGALFFWQQEDGELIPF